MAHEILKQTFANGANVIVKITLKSDGSSGELTKAKLYDASDYDIDTTKNKLVRIAYTLNGFSAELFWDATTDVPIITLENDEVQDTDFSTFGGIINNAGTGRTGDILISTAGFSAATSNGFIMLYMFNKNMPSNKGI